jgi:hypothetical protein
MLAALTYEKENWKIHLLTNKEISARVKKPAITEKII